MNDGLGSALHETVDVSIGLLAVLLVLEAFLSAVVAGIVITVMTWMQSGSESDGGRIVAAVGAAFLLSYGELGHVIVASLEILARPTA